MGQTTNAPIKRLGHSNSGIKRLGHTNGSSGGKNNFIAVSDILYWINKQDVEPFKMINYKMKIAALYIHIMY